MQRKRHDMVRQLFCFAVHGLQGAVHHKHLHVFGVLLLFGYCPLLRLYGGTEYAQALVALAGGFADSVTIRALERGLVAGYAGWAHRAIAMQVVLPVPVTEHAIIFKVCILVEALFAVVSGERRFAHACCNATVNVLLTIAVIAAGVFIAHVRKR